jgi:hypothetical protein
MLRLIKNFISSISIFNFNKKIKITKINIKVFIFLSNGIKNLIAIQ